MFFKTKIINLIIITNDLVCRGENRGLKIAPLSQAYSLLTKTRLQESKINYMKNGYITGVIINWSLNKINERPNNNTGSHDS